jgi:hypothetical protein
VRKDGRQLRRQTTFFPATLKSQLVRYCADREPLDQAEVITVALEAFFRLPPTQQEALLEAHRQAVDALKAKP